MLKLVPQTIASDISGEMFRIFNAAHSYLDESDDRMRKLWADLDKLGKVDAAERSILLVSYYLLCGNREQGEYWAKNAARLNAGQAAIDMALLNLYVNMGYYTLSIPHLARATDPANGTAVVCLSQPMFNGALHLFKESHRRAKEMNLVNLPPLPPFIEDAVEVMDYWQETDLDYAAALDIAGEVMRARRLIVCDGGLSSNAIMKPLGDGAPILRLVMTVAVDFETSLEMTSEYLEKLASSRIKIPQSMTFEFGPLESVDGN